jgi:adenosylmethionine-8-amino-7-oxononanoate aminotransferase
LTNSSKHGVITRPLRGNTPQISPPFITTDDEIRQLVRTIDVVIAAQPDD